jgi:hypothetical protein
MRGRATARRLLNYLIGGGQQRFRDGEAERLGCFEVDRHHKFGRQLDRKLCRLGAA